MDYYTDERVISSERDEGVLVSRLARYTFAAQFVKKKVVLDVGCGTGRGSEILARYAQKVIGVDSSKEAIGYCQRTYQRDNLEFGVGDARSLGFPKGSFDVVVSFETIEHFSEHEKFLDETVRVLKKNGILIISTPNREIYALYQGCKKDPFHIKELSIKEFRKLLKAKFRKVTFFGQWWFSQDEAKHYLKEYKVSVPFQKTPKARKVLRMIVRGLIPPKRYSTSTFLLNLRARVDFKHISKKNIEEAILQLAICNK